MHDNITKYKAYTESLLYKESKWWKQLFDRQLPYRWNLKRLNLGYFLDVGCGLGRNLKNLGGNGVGVDHNMNCVEVCRKRGFTAFHTDEFQNTEFARNESFDALLIAHVIEHNLPEDAENLIKKFLPYIKNKGKVVMICPQELSFTTDHTHINFCDFDKLNSLGESLGLTRVRHYSFPFPRPFGKIFAHNEFVAVFRKP